MSEKSQIFAASPDLSYPRIWFWLGVILVAVVVLLSLGNPPASLNITSSDKVGHAIAYAALMGWFMQIFTHKVARVILAMSFIGLGVGLEFLQGMVPTRQFELLDMAANTTGVLIAWVLGSTFMGTVLVWFERVALPPRVST
ncbi:MAG: VanZ family protein [Gammaproteobacteria bacterium]|nr:VanZ family protein [Gammaproteobacteria bacterium]